MTLNVAYAILALLGLGSFSPLVARAALGRIIVYAGCGIICAALVVAGFLALGGPIDRVGLPIGLPGTGTHLRLDPLSGFFLVLIGIGGGGSSVFAIGYGRSEREPHRVLPFFPAFLAGMALVVIADDAFAFLFGWELMSLASWALVMTNHREPETAHAGYVYLIMAAASGMVLLLTFALLLAGTGSVSFDAIRAAGAGSVALGVVPVLALIGAGSKAGLVPLHVWLPLAHPAAPSHVSALMSGVMTKVAVYGFIRIAFDLAGPLPWWTATAILLFAGATAFLGVLHAVMERDLKRLLAYSTVENIGIIFIGLGLAVAFQANGLRAGAALALTAALFHALNHTLFKSLLFFGAGNVLHATHTRDLDQLGGLVLTMPKTAVAFLVGCLAISGLPPLNGFVSEWLTFQGVLLRPEMPQWGLKLMIPVNGALLALTAALAACCFVRAFGVGFLGRPRTAAAYVAKESDAWSVGAMWGFAAMCLAAGIVPGAVIDMLAPVTQMLVGVHMPRQLDDSWTTIIPVAASRSSYNGLLTFCFIAISSAIAVAALRGALRAPRRGPAWDCGFPDPAPVTQYAGGSFAQPIRRVFGTVVFDARDSVDMPEPGDSRPALLTQRSADPLWNWLYRPVAIAVNFVTDRVNAMQYLSIRRYLGFVFATLVALLMALTLWQ